MSTKPTSFTIDIPAATLDDLRERLARTRWPDALEDQGWDLGTEPGYLKELCAYWRDGFDWRAAEARLNELPQFRATVDGVGLHFVHAEGKGPKPLPILLTHGWPDSFWRFSRIIPLLTDPGAHGGDPADAFTVVAPSIPGYGFSDHPTRRGTTPSWFADLFDRLMGGTLGYDRYVAHGGDVGSGITEALAVRHADHIPAIHLTDVPYGHLFRTKADDLSEAEREYLAKGQAWQMAEGGYALEQSTKPHSLAPGLNDSPAGLAAWIVEKFRSWSDCGGDVETRFSKDDLLTNITIYWATETIAASVRLYAEQGEEIPERVEVPTAVAIFPFDLVPAPREFAARIFDLRRFTEMPRGGHFAAFEEPELLAADLRDFFRDYR